MSDEPLSKRDLLRLGAKRLSTAGAYAAEMAIESMADRFTPLVARPPGALTEMSFLLACTRCNECSRACPVGAIQVLDDRAGIAAGTPFLDVNENRPCVACSDAPCMRACETGALRLIDLVEAVMGTAEVDRELCLSWTGTPCTACSGACPYPDTAMVLDELGRVYVDPRHCIGCGMCRSACPTAPKSIKVRPPPRF